MKPWLLIPPGLAHKMAPRFLPLATLLAPPTREFTWRDFTWRGLHFRNPLGIAGGLDKNARHIQEWCRLGAGFLEVGTVTPRPQEPNRGRIIDRNASSRSLWNKMGFPNEGAQEALKQLKENRPNIPVFVNIGKNRHTPIENASDDYANLIHTLECQADVFVINISSPNTQGLRDLQSTQYLSSLLGDLRHCTQKPILVKLSPDLTPSEFEAAIEAIVKCEMDGAILTNTTLFRPNGSTFPLDGGLSGAPLAPLSISCLKKALTILGPKKKEKDLLLISVGGVLSPEEVIQRLSFGADLVQIYSAIVFEGPLFFAKTARYVKNKQTIMTET